MKTYVTDFLVKLEKKVPAHDTHRAAGLFAGLRTLAGPLRTRPSQLQPADRFSG
jgi:hypothetical protein